MKPKSQVNLPPVLLFQGANFVDWQVKFRYNRSNYLAGARLGGVGG